MFGCVEDVARVAVPVDHSFVWAVFAGVIVAVIVAAVHAKCIATVARNHSVDIVEMKKARLV